jgi:DNA-binding transcriptional ArsR family regulator
LARRSLAPVDPPGQRLSHNLAQAARAAELVKALSHPGRLRIIALLCDRAHHVSELAAALELSQCMVSQQLRFLRIQGLVLGVRKSGHTHYQLACPSLKELIRCIETCSFA